MKLHKHLLTTLLFHLLFITLLASAQYDEADGSAAVSREKTTTQASTTSKSAERPAQYASKEDAGKDYNSAPAKSVEINKSYDQDAPSTTASTPRSASVELSYADWSKSSESTTSASTRRPSASSKYSKTPETATTRKPRPYPGTRGRLPQSLDSSTRAPITKSPLKSLSRVEDAYGAVPKIQPSFAKKNGAQKASYQGQKTGSRQGSYQQKPGQSYAGRRQLNHSYGQGPANPPQASRRYGNLPQRPSNLPQRPNNLPQRPSNSPQRPSNLPQRPGQYQQRRPNQSLPQRSGQYQQRRTSQQRPTYQAQRPQQLPQRQVQVPPSSYYDRQPASRSRNRQQRPNYSQQQRGSVGQGTASGNYQSQQPSTSPQRHQWAKVQQNGPRAQQTYNWATVSKQGPTSSAQTYQQSQSSSAQNPAPSNQQYKPASGQQSGSYQSSQSGTNQRGYGSSGAQSHRRIIDHGALVLPEQRKSNYQVIQHGYGSKSTQATPPPTRKSNNAYGDEPIPSKSE